MRSPMIVAVMEPYGLIPWYLHLFGGIRRRILFYAKASMDYPLIGLVYLIGLPRALNTTVANLLLDRATRQPIFNCQRASRGQE